MDWREIHKQVIEQFRASDGKVGGQFEVIPVRT
jgi:hypothetical protein